MDTRALFYQSFMFLVSLLPHAVAFRVAALAGRLRYRRRRASTGPLQADLERTLGVGAGQAEDWIKRSFDLAAWEDLESWLYSRMGQREIHKVIEIRGLPNLNAVLDHGKGAILCTGHIRGLFAFIAALGLLDYKVNVIRRAPRNVQGPVGRWFNRRSTLISGARCNFLWMHPTNLGVAVQASRALARNEIVIVLIDALFGTESVELPFLNRRVPFPSGHIVIAQASGAPLLNCFVYRPDHLGPQVAEIEQPFYASDDLAGCVRYCISRLEEKIVRYPAGWIWFQDRQLWKAPVTPPPV